MRVEMLHVNEEFAWLIYFLKANFYEPCTRRDCYKKGNSTIYCTVCMGNPFCVNCKGRHENNFKDHKLLEVVKASHYAAVKYKDIKEVLQVEGIRINIINSNQILFLRCRQTKKDTGSREKGHCKRCNWPLENKGSYCSIECMLLVKSPHLHVELANCNNPSTSVSSVKSTCEGTSQRRKVERGKSTAQSALETSEPSATSACEQPSLIVSRKHEVPVKLPYGRSPQEAEPACTSKEVVGPPKLDSPSETNVLNYRTRSRKGVPSQSPFF